MSKVRIAKKLSSEQIQKALKGQFTSSTPYSKSELNAQIKAAHKKREKLYKEKLIDQANKYRKGLDAIHARDSLKTNNVSRIITIPQDTEQVAKIITVPQKPEQVNDFESLIRKIIQDTVKETIDSLNPPPTPLPAKEVNAHKTICAINQIIEEEGMSSHSKVNSIVKAIEKALLEIKNTEKSKADPEWREKPTEIDMDAFSKPTDEESLLHIALQNNLQGTIHRLYPNEIVVSSDKGHIDPERLGERLEITRKIIPNKKVAKKKTAKKKK